MLEIGFVLMNMALCESTGHFLAFFSKAPARGRKRFRSPCRVVATSGRSVTLQFYLLNKNRQDSHIQQRLNTPPGWNGEKNHNLARVCWPHRGKLSQPRYINKFVFIPNKLWIKLSLYHTMWCIVFCTDFKTPNLTLSKTWICIRRMASL